MSFESIEHPLTADGVTFLPGQRAKYVKNTRSFGAFMRSEQMRDVTTEVAEDIAKEARELSPVSNLPEDQVHMRDQFVIKRESGLIKTGGNFRVLVEIENDDPAAAPNEFGSPTNKRHRMLGQAGAKFGDFKPEGGPTL